MLLISFGDNDEEVLNAILSVLKSFDNICHTTHEYINEQLIFNGLKINIGKRTVFKKDQEIKLTFIEFEILCLLASNPGRVFSKEQIYDIVWNEPYYGDYNIVMSHIRNIREKIEDNPSEPIYIQTVWGIGYRFNQYLK